MEKSVKKIVDNIKSIAKNQGKKNGNVTVKVGMKKPKVNLKL